ncbi:MAG: TetR/AcrR family transcriptional regulator [Myxococcales bacterium]|nr:TetR/AcrR family transcriptional regulator [Myxococcales bacterium]
MCSRRRPGRHSAVWYDSAQSMASATARAHAKLDGRVARAQRLREERRAQVLDAARRLFAEKGYHATSVHDIIAAADIARGTFYLYFESKRAIFGELLEGFFTTVSTTVRRIDTSAGASPPIVQMHEGVARIFEILEAERPMARILIREAVGLDEDFDKKLADFYGRVAGLIERALRTGIAMGLVRECDPHLVSWCVLGSIKEVCDRVFVIGHERVDLPRLGRELVDFNMRGIFR